MIDVLPPEIFDAILDQAHDIDEEARLTYRALDYDIRIITTKPVKNLLSYSLVCRSWLPRTRLHIFNNIYLPYFDRTIGITFGALVAHPLCTFRSHVRKLGLHESPNQNPAEASWLNSVLPQLALLTNVEQVSIMPARFTHIAEDEWREGVQLFGPQLKRLYMHSTTFDQVGRMTELVSRCTNLESLILGGMYLDEDSNSAPEGPGHIIVRPPPPRCLRLLTLHGIALSAEFLTWLCPSPGSIQVPTVALEGISARDVHHVSRFLHDIGASITSLALRFPKSDSTDAQDAFCRVADLTALTNVETLLFGLLGIFPSHLGRAMKHVPRILAKLHSPSLKKIIFHVSEAEQAADFEMIDWGSIVPMLNSMPSSTLEVSIRPIGEHVLEETNAWFDEHVKRKLRRNVEIRFETTHCTHFSP